MYVKDVENGKRTYRHIFYQNFLNMVLSECNAIYVKDRSNTPKGCNAMYIKDVEDRKGTYTHILAHNFLKFNGFSIQKKSWEAETKDFPNMLSNLMYVEACQRCRRLSLTSSTCFNIHSI